MDSRAVAAFYRDAACRDTDPVLFDQTDVGGLSTYALAYCARCPVTTICRSIIRPSRTYYDGVAAAAVYRNGRVVASLARDPRIRQLVATIEP